LTRFVLLLQGSISKIASMIPGLPQEMLAGGDDEGAMRMKRMIFIPIVCPLQNWTQMVPFSCETARMGASRSDMASHQSARGSGTSVREGRSCYANIV